MLGLTALPHRALAQPPPPSADHARARERGLRAPTSGARRSCAPASAARTSAATSSATGRVADAIASRSPAAAIGRGEKGRRKK